MKVNKEFSATMEAFAKGRGYERIMQEKRWCRAKLFDEYGIWRGEDYVQNGDFAGIIKVKMLLP